MSDLTDELQRMADDAACQARPLPTVDVIRRGDRRRRRAIAQQSLGGLSVAGVAAAVIFAGAAGAPAAPASSGALLGGNTLIETTSSPTGDMTVQVKYRYEPRGKIKLLSVTYSGDSKVAAKKPSLIFMFGPADLSGPPQEQHRSQWQSVKVHGFFLFFVSLRGADLHNFAGSLPASDIDATNRKGGLIGNETLSVTLASVVKSKAGSLQVQVRPVMQDGLVLTPGRPG